MEQRTFLEQLLRDHLRDPKVRFAPDLDRAAVLAAVATFGTGCQVLDGERVIAMLDERKDREAPPFRGWMITGRRFLAPELSIPLERLTAVQATSPTNVELSTSFHSFAVETRAAEWLAFALSALLQVNAYARLEPFSSIVSPSPEDDLGLIPLMIAMHDGVDARANSLMTDVERAYRTRTMPREAAVDLALRTALFHRSVNDGRAMADGWWLSPLVQGDFRAALALLFGAASRDDVEKTHGTQVVHFEITPATIPNGAAWLKDLPPTRVEFRLTKFRHFGAFMVRGVRVGGEEGEQIPLRTYVLGQLVAHEQAILSARVARGWSESAEDVVRRHRASKPAAPPSVSPPAALPSVSPPPVPDTLPGLPVAVGEQEVIPSAPRQSTVPMRASAPPLPAKLAPRSSAAPPAVAAYSVEPPPAVRSIPVTRPSAVVAPIAMSPIPPPSAPASELDEERRAWMAAIERGDQASVEQAAVNLQRAAVQVRTESAVREAVRAFEWIATRFPARKAEASSAMGDCLLYSVLGLPNDKKHLPALERARAYFGQALYLGCPKERVDDSLWQTCLLLSRTYEDPGKRAEAIAAYRTSFADGRHASDAEEELEVVRDLIPASSQY